MKVHELIDHLSRFDQHARVMIQDRAITLVSLDVVDIKEVDFYNGSTRLSESVIQLIPEGAGK